MSTGPRETHVLLQIDARAFVESLERVSAALDEFSRHYYFAPDGTIHPWDRHHPRPLPINGREYRRRQRSRRRR